MKQTSTQHHLDLNMLNIIRKAIIEKDIKTIQKIYLKNNNNLSIIKHICLDSVRHDFLEALKYLNHMGKDVLLDFNTAINNAVLHQNIPIIDYLLSLTPKTDRRPILNDIIRVATNKQDLPLIYYIIQQGADSNDAINHATEDFKPLLLNFLVSKSEEQELSVLLKNPTSNKIAKTGIKKSNTLKV